MRNWKLLNQLCPQNFILYNKNMGSQNNAEVRPPTLKSVLEKSQINS